MARIARIIAPGLPHHITQRGNYGQNIFVDEDDKVKYLCWVRDYCAQYGVVILAYCLMDDHVHFIAVPGTGDALAQAFNYSQMRYAQYFNSRIKAVGHLWQGRFASCILDAPSLAAAVCAIEREPVRQQKAAKPWDWIWSSAAYHAGVLPAPLIPLGDLFHYIETDREKWPACLKESDDPEILQKLKKHTASGRPLGSADFIRTLEGILGRTLTAAPRGRPRKYPLPPAPPQ